MTGSAQTLVQDSGVVQTATQPLSDRKPMKTAIPPALTRAHLGGAERHAQAVTAAIAAGTLRRPYPKGWARAQGGVAGPWPARPASP